MTAPGSTSTAEVPAVSPLRADAEGLSPRHRRRWIAGGVAAALVVAGAVVGVTNPFAKSTPAKASVTDNAYPTSQVTIARRELSSQTAVDATLGYTGSYSVVNQAQGTLTSVPAVGQVVSQGQVLYQVSGNPVVLLYGSTPAYRSLSEGASASDVTGPDVAELNADLVALGYATTSEIPAGSNQFSWWTKEAVEKLQAALGVTQNGTLALGQAVFLASAARITTLSATLAAPVQPGGPILTATSTTRQVTIALDASQQSEVKVGDKVTITLPDGQTTPGVVSSVGTVATAPASGSSNSTPTIPIEVTPSDPAATGSLDQAPVQVSITTAAVESALVVPVNALLALAGGGYAVEVVGANGIHSIVNVTLGLFDNADGLVQVTGSGLAPGQKVVVPAT
jgi:hypothetical protein